jgi:hypothetical protein
MIDKQTANENIEKWFYTFKEKLVDDFPEYRKTFDSIIVEAYEKNLLYQMMETAYYRLTSLGENKGGFDYLFITDYINVLEFAYEKHIN